ncbi:MAG: hypothetical protein HDT36_00615 [Clostridiales bacterium]|nr:hypothetical protein [Clostridiales bacterium]
MKKPIIVIMTSKDESDGISKKLAEALERVGTHNVAIVSDDKYGVVAKRSALDRLMDNGSEYQYLLERKDKGVIMDRLRVRKYSKRVNRIKNMLKRFRPQYILCLTPYAHHCAVEAKRKLKFDTQIIYMLQTFTMPKRGLDDITNVYIVENADVKAELVRAGIRSKDVMTRGLPYEIQGRAGEESIADAKQELGLPRAKTVFVNIRDGQELSKAFDLLLDQGGIASLVVYCENAKLRQALGSAAAQVPDVTVVFVQTAEKIDEYLSVCDLAITSYDTAIIYKCFRLGIPSIVYSRDEHAANDINYLVSHDLCLRAREDIEIVALEYKLLQTELAESIGRNGQKWVELNTLDNIANFLASYIAV